jgi:hypothetical protein
MEGLGISDIRIMGSPSRKLLNLLENGYLKDKDKDRS